MKTNAKYISVSDSIRHYSNLIWQVRALAIGQGILILSGAYLVKDTTWEFILINIFGVIFTSFLRLIHINYMKDFITHLKTGIELEKESKSKKEILVSPWTRYGKKHKKIRGKKRGQIFTLFVENGFFNLMVLAYICLIVFKLINLLKPCFQ